LFDWAYDNFENKRGHPMVEKKVQSFFNNPRNARKFGIKLAYLFGSATDGRFGARSDLDIGVLFKKQRKPKDILQKSALLQIELGHQISRPIDLAILNFASPLLKREVIRGINLFAEREATQAEFEKEVGREYEKYEKTLNRKFKQQLWDSAGIHKLSKTALQKFKRTSLSCRSFANARKMNSVRHLNYINSPSVVSRSPLNA
jgi:predicted nucleotidyltransferase